MWLSLLQTILTTLLVLALGSRIGAKALPDESRGMRIAIGSMATLAIFTIVGTIIYYTSVVTPLTFGIGAVIATIGILVATQSARPTPQSLTQNQFSLLHLLNVPTAFPLVAIAIIALAAWWTAISATPITDAVRSPWHVISPITILALGVSFLSGFLLLAKKHASAGSIILLASFLSLFCSASVIFPLGYGFDPFLHRATIAHIVEFGTITPKPMYYIGEYALEILTHFATGAPLFLIDIFLVPVLAAITLVIAIRRLPIGVIVLLLALGNFVTTTPQALAYLFAMLAVITVPKTIFRPSNLIIPALFAITAMMCHPLAGVPAIMFVVIVLLREHRWLTMGAGMLTAVLLPAMFVIQALLNHAPISLTLDRLWQLHTLPITGFLMSNGNPWLDALYLIGSNAFIIIGVLAIIGFVATKRNRTPMQSAGGIVAIALMSGFVITALGIDFTYLISYERQDFALRFLTLASIFALPLAEAGIAAIGARLPTFTSPGIALIIFTLACTASYTAYPRHDGYARSAAFNVSAADIHTVYAINRRESSPVDYIVLANQATSSAALQEFGFLHYYPHDIFYYPIPTGGPLYQRFLAMVDQGPSRQTIDDALAITGASTVYFVVSEYWWKSDAIIENAKQTADEWFAVDDGKATIFIYQRAIPSAQSL